MHAPKPRRPFTKSDMLGTDVFSLASGIVGLVGIVVSLRHWLSPWRRLRALDTTIEKAKQTLAIMQEEHAILDRTIVLRALEQLHWCVESSRHAADPDFIDVK
jgi:hypothetical protein